MPRRAIKIISAVVRASRAKKSKVKGRAMVRHVAQGTLLAMTLAAAQFDTDAPLEKKRLFDVGLLDRLRAPIMRNRD